ncbi:unnamed protein product [Calypogeia fissa]
MLQLEEAEAWIFGRCVDTYLYANRCRRNSNFHTG